MKITKAELKRIISEELTAMAARQELGEEATVTDTGVVEEGTRYSYEKALIDAGRYTRAQLDAMEYADIQAAWNKLDQEVPADL